MYKLIQIDLARAAIIATFDSLAEALTALKQYLALTDGDYCVAGSGVTYYEGS